MKKSGMTAVLWLILLSLIASCAPTRRLPGVEAPAGEPSLREIQNSQARLSMELQELQNRHRQAEALHHRILTTLETLDEKSRDNAEALAFHQQAIDHLNRSVERILDTLSTWNESTGKDTTLPSPEGDPSTPEHHGKTARPFFQNMEPPDVVTLYDRCLGTPCMDQLAEATTARFRDQRSPSAWVHDTRRHLRQTGYRRIYSRVLESKTEEDRAVLIHEGVVERHSQKILLKSRFHLVRVEGKWSIDRMEILEEKILR